MTVGGSAGRITDARGRVIRHVVVPAMMSVAFFSVALTPVALLGCRNRGLLALLVASASGLWSISAAIAAVRRRARGDADAGWWAIRSLVLSAPVVAMLALA